MSHDGTKDNQKRERRSIKVGQGKRLAYRVPEFAAATGLSRAYIYQLVKAGELPSRTVGRAVLIPAAAAEEWLAEVE